MQLIPPKIVPPLDPAFRPGVLAVRYLEKNSDRSGGAIPARLALEQADGSVFHHNTLLPAQSDADPEFGFPYLERCVKFLLWAWGGHRLHVDAPESIVERLRAHYIRSHAGEFDAEMMGARIYERPFEVLSANELPPARSATAPLGRHLNGNRIGFDLGGSDRKVAAIIEGEVVFSEETVWDPYRQTDPEYHIQGINDSLRKAAKHLPRVDAIGGSAAGVYVNNQVKVASLFRGVPPDAFNKRVKNLFIDLQRQWNVPLEVVNDGEVTALAGSMSLGVNSVLGIALGTSVAAGYVTPEGNITSWLNELAFAPLDYRSDAPIDEWSGDYGCAVQYYSQQAVGRLMAPAGIDCDPELALPDKLKLVQTLMAAGDSRARRIYETIGTYLGYGVAHYSRFYDFQHLLILGRVTSGSGGNVIVQSARKVLEIEFAELAERIRFHVPDEKDKRHGQAIAAASLPSVE